jgi:hypothetical protein
MANTTNFGWETPDDTDLVKDGAAAIRTLAGAIDTSLLDLKGGTTNQVLAKNSNTDMDFKWVADAAGMTNPMTTTGDTIYSSSGSTPARLAIGSTGNVLTVAGGVPTWAAPAGGGKVLQVVQGTTTTSANINTTTLTDTNLTATITPTLNTSKILVIFSQSYYNSKSSNACAFGIVLKRDSTTILDLAGVNKNRFTLAATGATATVDQGVATATYLDAPATTSALTYKTQAAVEVVSGTDFYCQLSNSPSTIILLEIGA